MFRHEGFLVRSGRGNTALEVAISSLFVMSGFVWSIELYRDILLTDTVDRAHAAVVRKASRSLDGTAPETALANAVTNVLLQEGLASDWSLERVDHVTGAVGPLSAVESSLRIPMMNFEVTYRHNGRGEDYTRRIYLLTG